MLTKKIHLVVNVLHNSASVEEKLPNKAHVILNLALWIFLLDFRHQHNTKDEKYIYFGAQSI